jgi:hypothetical protein
MMPFPPRMGADRDAAIAVKRPAGLLPAVALEVW